MRTAPARTGTRAFPPARLFFSSRWRELYKHTLREADRLGLEISLNIQSGWNLGGPVVKAEDAAKKLVWSETKIHAPADAAPRLPPPPHADPWYQDLFVLAVKIAPDRPPHPPIRNLSEKALLTALGASAPDTSVLLTDVPATAGDEDAASGEVIDVTPDFQADGSLRWNAPAGDWRLLRFGCTVGDHARVSTASAGWDGYALDVYDVNAFKRYWDAVVEPLIADAGPLAGKSLKYLHTDSWEIEAASWTPGLREEFRRRRGYDLLPWLPVLAGYILDSREASNRFLFDFRRTMGDLAVDHHYKPFAEWAHRHGLQIHPESGGPHSSPFDAQRCLGMDDAPMSEFWAWSPRHRVGDPNRFFVKQPASAAHTYGHPLVLAEGFTTIGPHWQETLWNNLKPAFDKACTEGLNRLVWHAFVCSPAETGVPGQQYFAGTHLNPKVTWWSRSAPFFSYIDRCQTLLQRGLPVADALYYYGDNIPNFTQLRASDPARVGAGYDYDVIDENALLTRVSVKDGELVLPEGIRYRALVLPDRPAISLPVLRKIREFVAAGATVVGNTRPVAATGLTDFRQPRRRGRQTRGRTVERRHPAPGRHGEEDARRVARRRRAAGFRVLRRRRANGCQLHPPPGRRDGDLLRRQPRGTPRIVARHLSRERQSAGVVERRERRAAICGCLRGKGRPHHGAARARPVRLGVRRFPRTGGRASAARAGRRASAGDAPRTHGAVERGVRPEMGRPGGGDV